MTGKIDLLNREHFIENVLKVINQLSDIEKGCCFSIEGSWGIGKTFVLEEVEKRLDAIEEDKYFLFHYNCWEHDYYEEPAIAIVSAMLSSILEDKAAINVEIENTIKAGYEFVGKKLSEIAGIYLENKIGVNLIDWVKETREIKESNEIIAYEFDKLFNFSQTIEMVRKNLKEIAEKRTIILIVDELDRCIPQYAIKVLERLHHIFNGLRNVIVIMAVDRNQLEHSVEEMFGSRKDGTLMDVEKYLKKFIDFSMILDNGIINESFMKKYKFYSDKFIVNEEMDLTIINEILPILFQGIDIRRQEKIIEKANIVHSIVCDEKLDISVMVFEVLYEVLQLWNFEDMEFVTKINDCHYTNLEQRHGKERIEFLKQMETKAWSGKNHVYFNGVDTYRKCILPNLYGRVFWYFGNIFNDEYYFISEEDSILNNGSNLEIAKKYVEFGEIIK